MNFLCIKFSQILKYLYIQKDEIKTVKMMKLANVFVGIIFYIFFQLNNYELKITKIIDTALHVYQSVYACMCYVQFDSKFSRLKI